MMIAPAWLQRILAPGYSICERCRRPWKNVEPRIVWYEGEPGNLNTGCFALCINCWNETDAGLRLHYFWNAFMKHWAETKDWDVIEKAVLEASR